MENTKKIICNFIILLIFFSCHTHSNSNKYNQVNDILYTDSQGNYYFQYIYSGGSEDPTRYGYEDQVYDINTKDVLILKNILNTDKFQRIDESTYYMDDKHIFAISDYATDIYIKILDIKIDQYKVVGQYIKNSQKVYFGSREVEYVNAKDFDVMTLKVGGITIKDYMNMELGYDNKHLYYGYHVLEHSDLVDLELDKKIKDVLIKKYFPSN